MPTFDPTAGTEGARRRRRFGDRWGWHAASAPLLAAVVLLAMAPAVAAAARWQGSGDPSPATGGAQVVAHGVIRFGTGDIVWRIVERSAAPPANAASETATAGFLLADDGVLLVADAATNEQVRLAPGEAMRARGNRDLLRAGLGASAATYYAFELVDAPSANDAGDGEVLFVSNPFPGPEASHDVDLLREVLDAGGEGELPAGNASTLVLVTEGSLDVAAGDGGEAVRIPAGEAAAFDGALTFSAGDDGATYVAALVGPVVPNLLAPAGAASGAGTPAAASPAAAQSPATTVTATATAAAVATPDDDDNPAAADAPTATPDDADATAEPSPTAPAAEADAAPDGDADGLPDDQEPTAGSNAAVADTDGDGLPDGDEVLSFGSDPTLADTDGDGFGDGDEIAQGSLPTDPTSAPQGAAPVVPDAPAAVTGDGDGDGFPDEQELALGTDPADPDTDADGVTDGAEVSTTQTGPLNPDTDGDGALDGDEAANGTDPNDPASL